MINKLTLQSEKEYRNFGLGFGIGFLIVQIFPLIYGLYNGGYSNNWTTLGLIFTSLFSSPTILFLAIGFLKGYKEKAVFWVGILGIWMNVMLNLYIQQGGEVVYLQVIISSLSRKLVAMIITLLILRNYFNTHKLLHLFAGFGVLIIMATISSFLQFSDTISTEEITSQALWGALFYILGLTIGYIFFSIFNGQNDHEGTKATIISQKYKSSQLIFYFMILCLYFADFWMGTKDLRSEVNILFLLLFSCVGIVYFTKNIITIGMALTLLTLIGRIIAFYKDMSPMNTMGIVITLTFLVLFELSRREENKVKN